MIKRLYWWTGKNIGDAISPLIVEWMLGHKVQYGVARTFWNELWVFLRERIKYRKKYYWSAPLPPYKEKVMYAVGSILDDVETNAIIWGSGLGREWSRIHGRPIICAVRGKYTLRDLPNCYDKTKIAIGDPALLLPLIIPKSNVQINYTVGIIPHFMDFKMFSKKYGNNYKIIDIRTRDAKTFINEILQCEYILSTSLHGIIISHAYNKPAIWIRRLEMNVGDFKFHDYFSSVNIPIYDGFADYDKILTKTDIPDFFHKHKELAYVDPIIISEIQKNLIEAFPKENKI